MNSTQKDISENNRGMPDNQKADGVTKAFQAFVMEPLQNLSLKVDGLEAELQHRDDRIKELENRVKELESEFNQISAHLEKIESKLYSVKPEEAASAEDSVLDLQGLIAQAQAEAQEITKDDQQRFEQYRQIAAFWLERGNRLITMIREAAGATDEAIANSNAILEGLPEALKKALESSQQGLNIIGRMLQRLVSQDDRLERLAENVELPDNLPEFSENKWLELLEGQKKEKSARKLIAKNLDRIRKSSYKLADQAGALADKRQKAWLDFIGGQVLPILDGIVDGKNHTSLLIDELLEQYQDAESKLREWFNTYLTCGSTLLNMLNELGVHRMDIAPGMPIDFERHEPSSVEADAEMENEQIKEISRDGYEFVAHDGSRLTLRVARVVVVKNND